MTNKDEVIINKKEILTFYNDRCFPCIYHSSKPKKSETKVKTITFIKLVKSMKLKPFFTFGDNDELLKFYKCTREQFDFILTKLNEMNEDDIKSFRDNQQIKF